MFSEMIQVLQRSNQEPASYPQLAEENLSAVYFVFFVLFDTIFN